MSNQLPAKLKTADIARFALRASQLETAKPAIAYWCEYWIVNQLMAKGLHTSDGECLKYTTTLMDKLEQTKSQHAADDAIVDDTASQAYVEQFALETFERADRAVRADKVTKQTADTFLAAATFLELLNIWGELDPEIHAKIRYAKWNAVRIVKALKEGKDPNESNPKPEPAPEEQLQPLDLDDPEVQQLGGEARPRQASVEEVPDEQDHIESRLARQSTLDHSLHPSAQPSAEPSVRGTPAPPEKFDPYPRSGFPYTATTDDVSPMESSEPGNERDGSIGGGYFPEVPTFTSQTQPSTLPTAPSVSQVSPFDPAHLPQPRGNSAQDVDSFPTPRLDDEPPSAPQDFYRPVPPPQHTLPRQTHSPPVMSRQAPVPAPLPAQASRQQVYNTDDVAIAKAQKHARFAISALNFDDAATAVKELRAALETLGAQ